MAEYIYIYWDGDPGAYGEPSSTAPRRAAQLGATPYSARNVAELLDLFTQFTTRKLIIDRISDGNPRVARRPLFRVGHAGRDAAGVV